MHKYYVVECHVLICTVYGILDMVLAKTVIVAHFEPHIRYAIAL